MRRSSPARPRAVYLHAVLRRGSCRSYGSCGSYGFYGSFHESSRQILLRLGSSRCLRLPLERTPAGRSRARSSRATSSPRRPFARTWSFSRATRWRGAAVARATSGSRPRTSARSSRAGDRAARRQRRLREGIETTRGELAAPPVISVGDKMKLTHGRDVLAQTIGTPHASGPLVKFVKGVAIPAGAVVLVLGTDRRMRPPANTAAAILTPETIRFAHSGTSLRQYARATAARPAVALLGGRDDVLRARADRRWRGHQLDADIKPGRTWNAVGRLTGSDPALAGEVILLSAHLDHVGARRARRDAGADTIYNGADDDASGSTRCWSSRRRSRSARGRSARSSSRSSAARSPAGSGRGTSSHRPVAARADRREPAVRDDRPAGRQGPAAHAVADRLRAIDPRAGAREAGRAARADPHPEQSFFTRSDNIQFARRGVIAHTVSSYGLHKDYHQPSDELAPSTSRT